MATQADVDFYKNLYQQFLSKRQKYESYINNSLNSMISFLGTVESKVVNGSQYFKNGGYKDGDISIDNNRLDLISANIQSVVEQLNSIKNKLNLDLTKIKENETMYENLYKKALNELNKNS